MKTVLFLTDLHMGSHAAEIEGVYERAHVHGWHVVEVECRHSSRPVGDYLRTWKADGCIVTNAALSEPVHQKAFRGIPTVYIDPDDRRLLGRRHCVAYDPKPIAETAFRELASLSCASYAYVGWNEPAGWSEDRREAFESLARANGMQVASFTERWSVTDLLKLHKKLAKWLRKLVKPCGVFAANDYTASQVADACRFAGLEVPKEIAVLGVDNREIICENAATSLSSVEVDFHEAGRVSADLLAQLMESPGLPPETRTFGSGRLVRRESTSNFANADIRIRRAVERIRREACLGIGAHDVIADIGLPRRVAERWFRKAVGRSILGEINRVRLERVFALLRKPYYPISLIAQECGWQTDVFLKRLFKRETGTTMREWRKEFRHCHGL